MQGLNLKSSGIKRQYQIVKNVIKDSFGKFFSMLKVSLTVDVLNSSQFSLATQCGEGLNFDQRVRIFGYKKTFYIFVATLLI